MCVCVCVCFFFEGTHRAVNQSSGLEALVLVWLRTLTPSRMRIPGAPATRWPTSAEADSSARWKFRAPQRLFGVLGR